MEDKINLVESIKNAYKKIKDIKYKKYYTASLNRLLRAFSNEVAVTCVSKAAKIEALKRKIDLTKMTWDNQNEFDLHRQIFHYEHCIPIDQLVEKILNTNDTIESVLKDNFVCWTLVTESKMLDTKYKKYRKNWKKCFAEFNIKPILNK